MKTDINKLKENFTSIGPKLSKQVLKPQDDIDFPCFEKTRFLSDTGTDEVAGIF